jgi:hypothetical protein
MTDIKQTLETKGFKILPRLDDEPKHWFPIECPNGHVNRKMTATRARQLVNQNQDVCVLCRKNEKKTDRVEFMKKRLASFGATLVSLSQDRSLVYICKCGQECKSWESNVLRENCIGCPSCSNPFNSPEIQAQIKRTNLEKYGVINPGQRQDVKDKIKSTNLRKYGVENAMQDKEIFSRNLSSSFQKRKLYTFPSGKQVEVMGFEPFCLDYLLTLYKEEDIIVETKNIPHFAYEFDGKTKTYFPDIFIPKQNMIIEVKSTWTYEKDKDQNLAKFHAVNRAGYNLDLYVFDKAGKIMSHITFGKF